MPEVNAREPRAGEHVVEVEIEAAVEQHQAQPERLPRHENTQRHPPRHAAAQSPEDALRPPPPDEISEEKNDKNAADDAH